MDAKELQTILREIFDESEPSEFSTIILDNLSSIKITQGVEGNFNCVICLSYDDNDKI